MKMKQCRFCATEIPHPARVCPQCHCQLSRLARLKGALGSFLPLLIAAGSLGIAAEDKFEKWGLQVDLEKASSWTQILEQEVQQSAPRTVTMAAPPGAGGRSVPPPPGQKELSRQISEVETKIAQIRSPRTMQKELQELQRELLRLKLERNALQR